MGGFPRPVCSCKAHRGLPKPGDAGGAQCLQRSDPTAHTRPQLLQVELPERSPLLRNPCFFPGVSHIMQISGQIRGSPCPWYQTHVPTTTPMSPLPAPCPCWHPVFGVLSRLQSCKQRGDGIWASPTRTKDQVALALLSREKSGDLAPTKLVPMANGCFGAPRPQSSSAPNPDPAVGPSLYRKRLLPLSSYSPKCSTPVWSLSGCPHSVPNARGFGGSPPDSGTTLQAKECPHPSYCPELWVRGPSQGRGWLSPSGRCGV